VTIDNRVDHPHPALVLQASQTKELLLHHFKRFIRVNSLESLSLKNPSKAGKKEGKLPATTSKRKGKPIAAFHERRDFFGPQHQFSKKQKKLTRVH